MSEAWYDGLSEDAFKNDTDKAYEKASAKIRAALEKGLDFDTACSQIEVEDAELKKGIVDDMLKVIISEEHFDKGVSLDQLSRKLNVSVERLETAKLGMIEDVKNTSIKAFYNGLGRGNA